jgi:hypothetical protein
MPQLVSLVPFDELVTALRAHRLSAEAESVASLRSLAWTTSSEMIGELGLAVLVIERSHNTVPADIREALGDCMKEVRKVWPDIQ